MNGRRLHYLVQGDGPCTVVFESGGGGGSALQDLPVARRTARFARSLIYDRAGLGWSDPAEPGRRFDERVGDLAALLQAVGEHRPVVVVGSSFGGLLARAFADRYPDRVAGMVLVDAAEEEKYFGTIGTFRASLERELRAEGARASSGELARLWAEQLPPSQERDWFVALASRPSHYEGAAEELSAIDATPADKRRAGGFGGLGDKPLVVLRHDLPFTGDYAVWEDGFQESQRRLAGLSSTSVLVTARGCGHSIGWERPGLVAAAVKTVVRAAQGRGFDPHGLLRLAGRRTA